MRLATTRSRSRSSSWLMSAVPSSWRLAVGRHEQIVDLHRRGNEAQILLVGDERLQRRPAGLDAVRPRIAVKNFPDVVDLAHQERRHVTDRAQVEQFLQRDLLRLDEGIVEARGDERIALV